MYAVLEAVIRIADRRQEATMSEPAAIVVTQGG